MTLSSLKVWILGDNKAGHMAGSRGMVKALSKVQETEISWVHARLLIPGSHRLLAIALRLFPKAWHDFWIELFYRIEDQPHGAPDIICSAGRKTQYLNVLWARKYRAKNFFIGTLRNLPNRYFTAFITPLSNNETNHIQVNVPLTDVDRDALEATETDIQVPQDDTPIWALLIGGKTPGYAFNRQDWLNLAKAMQHLSEKHGGKWLLTTSRRSGAKVEAVLKSAVPSPHILDAVWYSEDPRKVVKPFLKSADAIFCTEDSMAMLGEAVCAGKPVYSLRPQSIKLDWKETEIVSHLVQEKKIFCLSLAELANGQANLPPLESFTLYKTSPLDELAEKLRPFLEK